MTPEKWLISYTTETGVGYWTETIEIPPIEWASRSPFVIVFAMKISDHEYETFKP